MDCSFALQSPRFFDVECTWTNLVLADDAAGGFILCLLEIAFGLRLISRTRDTDLGG